MDTARTLMPVNGRSDPTDVRYYPPLVRSTPTPNEPLARCASIDVAMGAHRLLATASMGGTPRKSDAVEVLTSSMNLARAMGWDFAKLLRAASGEHE